jgi:uncharacterized repeat protein (TIGR03803 family)
MRYSKPYRLPQLWKTRRSAFIEPLEHRVLLSSGPTVLASFDGADGNLPQGDLVLSGSTLYGTTFLGGANRDGEVFSEPITGGMPTVLTSFNQPYNGGNPVAALTLSGSTLYGAAMAGTDNGKFGPGEVFSLPTSGGTPTILTLFNGNDGASPSADLILSNGILYSTTPGPNIDSNSEVFSVPATGGTPTVLASFSGTTYIGAGAGMILSGTTLYGTACGGANGDGEVFSLSTTGGMPTVLASFSGTDGDEPVASVTLSGSTLYGTTEEGGELSLNDGAGDGTVFSVPITGGTPTLLASFDGTNGARPVADLIVYGSTLYGTTESGGAYGDGEVFSLPVTGGTPTMLASFDGTNGANPVGGVVMDSNGNLYGTTISGGAYNDGTVYEVSGAESAPPVLLVNVSQLQSDLSNLETDATAWIGDLQSLVPPGTKGRGPLIKNLRNIDALLANDLPTLQTDYQTAVDDEGNSSAEAADDSILVSEVATIRATIKTYYQGMLVTLAKHPSLADGDATLASDDSAFMNEWMTVKVLVKEIKGEAPSAPIADGTGNNTSRDLFDASSITDSILTSGGDDTVLGAGTSDVLIDAS